MFVSQKCAPELLDGNIYDHFSSFLLFLLLAVLVLWLDFTLYFYLVYSAVIFFFYLLLISFVSSVSPPRLLSLFVVINVYIMTFEAL